MPALTSLPVLDVVIGMAFVYFLLSLVCSSVMEMFAHLLGLRGRMLVVWLRELVDGDEFTRLLEAIDKTALQKPKRFWIPDWAVKKWRNSNRPSYISRKMLKRLLIEADCTRVVDQVKLEFDESMERVSGWYKRQTQVVLFAIAIVLTVGLNADSLRMADRLMKDDTLRAAVVTRAIAATSQPTPATGASASTGTTPATGSTGATGAVTVKMLTNDLDRVSERIDAVQYLGLPVGWTKANLPDTSRSGFWSDLGLWTTKTLGWLITVFALTLGAPFWFDMLGNLTKLRASGGRPDAENR